METIPNTGLQTRTEYARGVEDAPRLRAIHTLTQLGMLTPVADLDLYHGRVANASDLADWRVDAGYANGGNDSGNANVNNRATLYTSERTVAQDFAIARRAQMVRQNPGKTAQDYRSEVHKITTYDADAVVIDKSFDETKLAPAAKARYDKALQALVLRPTEGSPLDFKARTAVIPFAREVARLGKQWLSIEDVIMVTRNADIDRKVALQLAGAYNARTIALTRPQYLAQSILRYPGGMAVIDESVNGQKTELPVNLEYAQQFLRGANIVGIKQSVDSGTLNRSLTTVSFFNLHEATTPRAAEARKAHTTRSVGALAASIGLVSTNEKRPAHTELLELLGDPYAKPHRLIEAAKKLPGYDAIFDAHSGNSEGFTIGEHTETVLRNFDENYADRLPV